MPVRPRGDGFQADFTHGAVRYREQFPTLQEGLQWEADTRAALIAGRPLPGKPSSASAANLTLKQLADRTIERHWKGTKNELGASYNAYSAVEFFGANTPVRAVYNAAKIDEFIGHLMKQGNGGSTINRKLAALSKMGRYGIILGALDALPPVERRKEGEARERFLTFTEAEALIGLMNHWGKADEAWLTTFLVDTGARMGEAITVRVRDIGEDRATLGAAGASKNGEWRVVPLTRRLREALPALRRGLPDAEAVFGSRVNRYTYAKLFIKACEHLNLGDDVMIHTLRHTCASWLVQRGVDLRRVKDWMGHKSIQTTMRYAKLAPTSLFEAVDALDGPPMKPTLTVVKGG